MAGNRVKFDATLKDGVSSGLDKIRDKFELLDKKGSFAGNVGAKAVAKGFSLIQDAVSGVVGVLGDAKAAYQEDQASQKQLDAALRANVASYNGNAQAIEKVLASRIRLGFSDDEQRASLASLVTRTKNASKALDLQRTAMDLARLRGIDLASASDLMGKAFSGQVGALRRAGIAVRENATAEEALLAVKEAVRGQAEAYANTDAGREAAAHERVQEAMEKIGEVVSKLTSIVLPFLVDNADKVVAALAAIALVVTATLIPALQRMAVAAIAATGPFAPLVATAALVAAGVTYLALQNNGLSESFEDLTRKVEEYDAALVAGQRPSRAQWAAAEAARAKIDELADAQDDARESAKIAAISAGKLAGAVAKIGDAATLAADKIATGSGRIIASLAGVREKAIDDATKMVTGYFDVLITKDNLAANNAEIAAQKRILASSTATAAEKQDARSKLHQLERDQIGYLTTLAGAGKSGTAEFQKSMDVLLGRLKKAHGEEAVAISNEIRLLNLLAAKAALAGIFEGRSNSKTGYTTWGGGRAHGGPVLPGQTYLVGEQGPETLVMGGTGGYVVPNAHAPARGGGGATRIIQLVVSGRVLAEVLDEEQYWSGALAGGSPAQA